MSRLDRLAHRPWLGMVLALSLAAVAVPGLLRLSVDNSVEVWLDRDGEPYHHYQEFLQAFGSEEFVLLLYEPPPALDRPFLKRLTDLRRRLEGLPHVRQTYCLSQVAEQPFGPTSGEPLRRELQTSPLYRDLLLSRDASTAGLWLLLDIEHPRERATVVEAVEGVLEGEPLGRPVRLAGSPVVNVELDRSSRRASLTFFPWVFGLSALLLLLIFRRPEGVVVPFVAVGLGTVWTLGLLAASGRSLNMVTVALPPLIWVLGLSTNLHLLSRTGDLMAAGHPLAEARSQAMRELWRPCAMSAVTTALGFGSLGVSSMQPVREMGVFGAVGVLACLLASFLSFPLLSRLLVLGNRRGAAPGGGRRGAALLAAISQGVRRQPVRVLTAAAVASVILGAASLGVEADSNVLEFFKPDAPLAVTYREMVDGFTGPYSLEVVLSPGNQAQLDLATFRAVERLGEELAAVPGVVKVLSAAGLVQQVERVTRGAGSPGEGSGAVSDTFRLPEDDASLARDWSLVSQLLPREARAFRESESGDLRLSLLARPMASGQHRRLVDELRGVLARSVDPAWHPRLTGVVDLLVDMQERLVASQVASFALAFTVILPVMGLLLRSWRYGALSAVPNLFPMLFAAGAMGGLGIPLDPATVMIAGIALGIAVDDTLHFLYAYLRQRRLGETADQAVTGAFQGVGRPMVWTTLVAATGFAVLGLSDFVPLLYFGLLTAGTLGAALLGDLFLLPALLLRVDRTASGPALEEVSWPSPG